MSEWIQITELGSIPLREGRCVKLGRREIAIFRTSEKVLAIDNACPHSQGPLCDGITSGTTVICPLHGWKIDLETGRVMRPDVPVGVRTYKTRVTDDGIVEIQMNAAGAEQPVAGAA